MAYTKTIWVARDGNDLDKYTKYQETADSVVLINTPGTITVQGTPFSPENMNHIEQGIWEAHNLIAAETSERKTADNSLQSALQTEAWARQAVDDGLRAAIAALQANQNEHEYTVMFFIQYIGYLKQIIESKLGTLLEPFSLVTEDGFYLVTENNDYFVVA
jgi:hypothetical protein